MRRWSVSILLVLGMISFGGRVCSQGSNSPGLIAMPNNPPVGIGTQMSPPFVQPTQSLQLHYDPTLGSSTQPAILLLSSGTSTTTDTFAILGLMPHLTTTYTSLASGQDLILHEHKKGDLIITNFWAAKPAAAQMGGSIRLATAGDSTTMPQDTTLWHRDFERLTIMPNGNVGINLPPDSATGRVDTVYEQLQLGGGSIAPPGYPDPIPGLTVYGGNRFEGDSLHGGGRAPYDWRFIDFNYYHNPWTGAQSRIAHMPMSGIGFSQAGGGLIELLASPYTTGQPLTDLSHSVYLVVTGTTGLELYSNESLSDPYHHLFDVYRPGYVYSPVTRNVNGLFFHHTPVYIGVDSTNPTPDFTNLSVHPDLGDGKTWMLAVNGPVLAKEIFVLDSTWPDYVFDSTYVLPKLDEVERFSKANHHLSGIPSAKEIDSTGVPLGKTEAKVLSKVEELTLYVIDLQKQIAALKQEMEALKKGGTQ